MYCRAQKDMKKTWGFHKNALINNNITNFFLMKNNATLRIIHILTLVMPLSLYAQKPIEIGYNRELFVDYFLIDKMENTKLKMHHPKNEGPVFYFDKPWEGPFSAYSTIIKDNDIYRAYYRGVKDEWKDGTKSEITCYAESKDGINWHKPTLGLYEVTGTFDNNVILANVASANHNFSPFIDKNPECKPDEKYKAVGGKSGLIAFTSKDGIHWKKIREEPVFTEGAFDSQNVSFWSEAEKKYVCYFRTWIGDGSARYRSVGLTTSDDFIHWSEPVQMKFGDTTLEDLYTQQTSPYYRAPHIYVAIGARFMPNRQVLTEKQTRELNVNPNYYNSCSDAIIMTTRGGSNYERTFMESFIRPGIGLQNWVSRSNYPALNVVPTNETEMSVYVNENYAQPTAHLKRYSMRIDGFASLSAGYNGGEMITKTFTFEGKELEINYSTSAAGEIKIEFQDKNGNPLPGYTLDDCQLIIGNEIKRIVTWNNNPDIKNLMKQPIKMRIYLKDADLFSFKFN